MSVSLSTRLTLDTLTLMQVWCLPLLAPSGLVNIEAQFTQELRIHQLPIALAANIKARE